MVKTFEGDGQVRIHQNGWQGSYGNVWDVILAYKLLLSQLEELKQSAATLSDSEQFRIGINLAWEKLDKYYKLLNETLIYYAVLALHPAYRWNWFQKIWRKKPEWVTIAKKMILEVWTKDYARLDIRAISRNSSDQSPPTKRQRFYDPFAANDRQWEPSRSLAVRGDEYEQWQRDRELSDANVRNPLNIGRKGKTAILGWRGWPWIF
jgi:hypothetical protein